MAGGGRLPFVAVEGTNVLEDLRDFLLRGAGALSVEGSQHASQTCALLPGQTGVRRDGTAMQGGEKSAYSFDTIEAIEVERNHRDSYPVTVGAVQDLKMLSVAEREAEISVGTFRREMNSPECRVAATEAQRGFGQHHDAGVFLRQPENGCVRRCGPGIDREIATPTAAGYVRSAVWGLRG